MGLLNSNTGWYFLLASKTGAEERHILDVKFGIHTLLSKNVPLSNIHPFIDGYADKTGEFLPGIKSSSLNISSSNSFLSAIRNSEYENVVIFVCGHGGMEGLDSPEPIKPYPFYMALRTAKNIKNAVIYFSQCEAGIFNLVSLTTDKEGFNHSNIVAIGAAGLHDSISTSSITENAWSANVFLGFIFSWISNPIDIDGDEKFTVIDSYKYAAYCTSNICKNLAREERFQTLSQKDALMKLYSGLEDKKKDHTITEGEMLLSKAAEERLKQNEYDQVPWILNVFPAMEIDF